MTARAAVPLDAAWTWWTDFGDAGERFPMSHGFGPMQRRILSREGKTWVMEERGPLGIGLQSRRKVTVEDSTRSIVEEFLVPRGMRSRWWMTPDEDGVRISRTLRVSSRYAKVSRWVAQRDLAFHVREMERALAPR